MIWGRNILAMSEARSAELAGKGVALTSYDPLTQTTLEAFYPPRGSLPDGTKIATPAGGIPAERYDFFPYTGITDQGTLDALAERVWEERSRQELEGQLTTVEMLADTSSQTRFDLLALGPGDAVRVEFEETDREALSAIPSVDGRAAYLVARGYSQGVAELMAKNFEAFASLRPEFCVKRVTVDLQTDGREGSFELMINYCSRIQIDGSAGGA
jgi:hypothetical protein